jgi:hypothetical protein
MVRFLSQSLTVDQVLDAIVVRFDDAQRDRLMDRLVGRVPGWDIRERRITPRPCRDRDAKMVRLRDEKHLSYPEIARIFHITPAAAAKAIQRFRRQRDKETVSRSVAGYDS